MPMRFGEENEQLSSEEIRQIVRLEVQNSLSSNPPIVHQANIPGGTIKQYHIENDLVFRGLAADRPDGSSEKKVYFATDTGVLSVWDGESWVDFARIPASPATYTITNVSTDRAYDANATSDAEVADVLGTLIADLQSIGLID